MDGPDPDSLPCDADNEPAFAELFDRFGERLYRAAFGMLGRREDAEDVVQEVFVAVLRAQPRLADSRDMTAYLFTALRRAAARHAVCRRRMPISSNPAIDEAAVEPQERSTPYDGRLQQALLALPQKQREVIALKIDGELSFADIAEVLGVSINTAASRYRYALDKLRTSLKEYRP